LGWGVFWFGGCGVLGFWGDLWDLVRVVSEELRTGEPFYKKMRDHEKAAANGLLRYSRERGGDRTAEGTA